ncbi:MAG: hypothetical protein JNL85_04610 [Rubrivivax sp.]|nr:hypothetical protein [Rubrivivax sp.]
MTKPGANAQAALATPDAAAAAEAGDAEAGGAAVAPAAPAAAVAPARADATVMRLPREPYPGLRPFLDFEAALLFGRQRQVGEILERLAATQFVAVLGGSGSGKSSLIHAGVTPALRSYGIPGAGDLWLPMVCTPGTNVSPADQAARRHSPVTRLVRRFGKLLKSRGSAAADARRDAEMAEVFRQEGGFARLLEAYGRELDVPPGPDPGDARVLFVIDQFEEVFHPTNKAAAGGPDEVAVLVERLLDHFFRPHPRCYVVITMRSEHLNDCATFLELPDAINKSSFLVRRLDAGELREAMVGPAQRFLRLMARQHAGTPVGAKLPAQVQFEPAVIERLLRDTTAITHDPDHLPLLQHMLARLWQAALERDDDMDALVPARITQADLARAVNAAEPGIASALADSVNTLRESVHNWPERIYLAHDAQHRAKLDTLLRRLALKDPNTGHYSQQRIEAQAAAALLGFAQGDKGSQQLRRLLAEGFLGSVDYLFWDAEDPARVTIKVSHESFIRGWRRFKALIDAESLQYEEYVAVLRRCAAWVEHERSAEDLLGSGELRRVGAGAVRKRIEARQPFDDWLHLLSLDREGARLLPAAGALAAFIEESERVERKRRVKRWMWPVLLLSVASITLGLALPTMFAVLIEAPTMRRAEAMLDAFGSTEAAQVQRAYATRAEAAAALAQMLDAAAAIDGARSGNSTARGRTSARLIEALDAVALVRRQGDFLQGVLSQSEPVVIDKLREVLGTSPLFAVPLPEAAAGAGSGAVVAEPAPLSFEGECSVPQITAPSRGRIVVAAPSRDAPERPGPRRALFVAAPSQGGFYGDDGAHVAVYAATWSAAEGLCRQGPLMLLLDTENESHAVFDSSLRHLVVLAAQGFAEGKEGVLLQQVTWRIGPEGEPQRAQRATVVTLGDPALIERLRRVAGPARVQVARTWSAPAGRVLDMGGEGWRIVSWQSRRVRTELREPQFRTAVPAAAGTPCDTLARGLPPVAGWQMRMLDAGALCLAVYRAPRPSAPGEKAEGGDELGVWAYPRPLPGTLERLAKRPLLPLAAVSPYANVPPLAAGTTAAAEPTWALGLSGEYAGWLVLAAGSPGGAAMPGEGDSPRLYGMPLTTCALWRLGQTLLPPGQSTRAAAGTCRDGP